MIFSFCHFFRLFSFLLYLERKIVFLILELRELLLTLVYFLE